MDTVLPINVFEALNRNQDQQQPQQQQRVPGPPSGHPASGLQLPLSLHSFPHPHRQPSSFGSHQRPLPYRSDKVFAQEAQRLPRLSTGGGGGAATASSSMTATPRSTRGHQFNKLSLKCNSQICCSYILSLFSTSLVVGGVLLSIKFWHYSWLVVSLFGVFLIFVGSCVYCCGHMRLEKKRKRYLAALEEEETEAELGSCMRRGVRRVPNNATGQSAPCLGDSRSVSQLSLNMIPQYFTPAIDSVSMASNLTSGVGTGTTAGSFTTSGAAATLGVSQIFSVNGQSFLILPIANNGTTLSQTTNSLQSAASRRPPEQIALENLLVKLPTTSDAATSKEQKDKGEIGVQTERSENEYMQLPVAGQGSVKQRPEAMPRMSTRCDAQLQTSSAIHRPDNPLRRNPSNGSSGNRRPRKRSDPSSSSAAGATASLNSNHPNDDSTINSTDRLLVSSNRPKNSQKENHTEDQPAARASVTRSSSSQRRRRRTREILRPLVLTKDRSQTECLIDLNAEDANMPSTSGYNGGCRPSAPQLSSSDEGMIMMRYTDNGQVTDCDDAAIAAAAAAAAANDDLISETAMQSIEYVSGEDFLNHILRANAGHNGDSSGTPSDELAAGHSLTDDPRLSPPPTYEEVLGTSSDEPQNDLSQQRRNSNVSTSTYCVNTGTL